MRNPCNNWWMWVIAIAAIIGSSERAQAFYWYGWPGSGVQPDRTLVGPPGPPRIPTGLPVVVTTPPPSQSQPPGGSHSTPEPATGLVAIVGLGVLAGVRSLRKGNRGEELHQKG